MSAKVNLCQFAFLAFVLLSFPLASAAPISFVDEQDKLLWQHKVFDGETIYELVSGKPDTIKATSHGSASALYWTFKTKPSADATLRWSWKIETRGKEGDPALKAYDDYPARVYVVFRYGRFPWQVRAINYVWYGHESNDAYWLSPYSENTALIPLRQSAAKVSEWQEELRQPWQDYQKIFKVEPMKILGVAIMTDTDNSDQNFIAHYRGITYD